MSALRAAIILILAGSATPALAERITCESHGKGAEACGTVAAGSSVRLVQQLGGAACVEGKSWGTGPDHDSIWVSGGCRAVFEVDAPYSDSRADTRADASARRERAGAYAERDQGADRDDDADRDDEGDYAGHGDDEDYADRDDDDAANADDERDDDRYDDRYDDRQAGSRYASADRLRAQARDACVDRAARDGRFDPNEVEPTDERWLGNGMFSVDLDTPDGLVVCTVDDDGNVTSLDDR
jgi:hypothetical protein